ncbi:putative ABC transporter type 1, transmembrane domain-containing protein [Helianthus annuus]|nr:putative ABC transporter type 1, transmembrane domain-containing protein [Helianthus annuus]
MRKVGSQEIIDDDDDQKVVLNDQPLSFFKLLSYADAVDYTLMAFASLGSVIHGLAQPLGYLLLGKAINAFGNNINDDVAMVKALKKVIPFVWYMAFATFPAGVIEVGGWMYASERQLTKLRLAYLKAVLKQEIGAFDTELTNGKIITGISSHMSIIQDAIGEKLGHFLSCFATFFTGVIIAFISCWEVSLLTLLVVPMILIIGATYTKKMNSISTTKATYLAETTIMVEQVNSYPFHHKHVLDQGGSVLKVELDWIGLDCLQTVSQIRTVFAFVGENSAIKSFSECMQRQLIISKGEALIKGVGTGIFQTVTFCSWALIVWIGAIVVVAKRAKGGDVIAAVMSILFGAM